MQTRNRFKWLVKFVFPLVSLAVAIVALWHADKVQPKPVSPSRAVNVSSVTVTATGSTVTMKVEFDSTPSPDDGYRVAKGMTQLVNPGSPAMGWTTTPVASDSMIVELQPGDPGQPKLDVPIVLALRQRSGTWLVEFNQEPSAAGCKSVAWMLANFDHEQPMLLYDVQTVLGQPNQRTVRLLGY